MPKNFRHLSVEMYVSHDRTRITFETVSPVPLTVAGSISETLSLLLNRHAEHNWRTRKDEGRSSE